MTTRTRTLWMLGCLASFALGACTAHPPKPDGAIGKVTPQMRSGSNELRTYRVAEWIAPDDRTLIVTAVDRSLFEARFKGGCGGLRLVDTIAFVFQGAPQVDRYSGVVLPDGTRCPFASFTPLVTAPAHPGGHSPEGNP